MEVLVVWDWDWTIPFAHGRSYQQAGRILTMTLLSLYRVCQVHLTCVQGCCAGGCSATGLVG